jgi:hypothetical protein
VTVEGDSYLEWLKNQERASRNAMEHHRQTNVLEEALLHERLKRHRKETSNGA